MADDALTGVVFRTLSTGTGAIVAEAVSAPNGYRMPPATLDGEEVSFEIKTLDDTEVERGRGVWTDATSTLTREQVAQSTNNDALVNFSAGVKFVSLVPLPGDVPALDHTHPPPDAATIETAYNSIVLPVDEIEARAGTSTITRQWSAQASRWTSEDAIAELTDGAFTAVDDPTDYSVATGTPFQVSAANGHDGTVLEVRRRNQSRRLTAADPSVVFTASNLELADYGEIINETGADFTASAGANTTLYFNGPVPDGETLAYHLQSHDGTTAEVYLIVPVEGGGGAVDSVNGQTGIVVLEATQIDISSLAPAGYTPASTSVEGHLSGISNAFVDHEHVAADITDSTASGRSLLTATSAGDTIAALSRDWGSLGAQTLDLAIAEAATSGGGATLDNGVQVNVGDEDITYSRATHGDAPAFWYDVALSPGRTLTFPRTQGVEGGICLVRTRTTLGDNNLTVRLENNDSPGTYVELPVPANHTRILRKSADSPSWWTDFGFHQNGAQVNHQFATQAEMEAGTVGQARSMSPERVAQAITALAGTGEVAPSLVSISGSTVGNLALTARAYLNVVVMAANGAVLTVPAGAPPGSSWLVYSEGASCTVEGQVVTQGHFATAIVIDDSPFTVSVQVESTGDAISLRDEPLHSTVAAPSDGNILVYRTAAAGGIPAWVLEAKPAAGSNPATSDVQFAATSRILGRTTGGAGGGEELTTAQAKTMLAIAVADVSGAAPTASPTFTGTVTLPNGTVAAAKTTFSATDRLFGRSTAGAGNGEEITCTQFGRNLIDDADAAAGRTTLGAAPTATPTFTGLTTVAGVKVAAGTATGTLTEAAHGGGVFTTSGNCTCPNAAGFSITLIAGGAHTVNVGTGAATSLASGDVLSVFIPAAGTVRAVKTLAADVITMPVS